MKVIGISGSPRPNRNSELLLKYSLKPFYDKGWEVKEYFLSRLNINPCLGCEHCLDSGICSIEDDMEQIYEDYYDCDAIIITSPVYYRNITAQLKAVIDRTHAKRSQKPLVGKVGGAIAVGRGTGGGQALALSIIYNFYLSSGMLCAPGELNGVSAVADKPGDILKQENKLRQAIILGENVLKFTKKLRT